LFDFKKLIPIKQFRKVPMDFYITTFADAGYVSNQNSFLLNNFNNTRFSNTMMASWGVGINFVSFYNSVIRLEISRNLAGEWNPRFSMAADI
jgi:outer membrane protein assembly factor BamA